MITNTYSYFQVAFHKLSAIKFFVKNPDDATIGVFFKNFIVALHKYEHAGRTPEALDRCTCLTLVISIINPVVDLLCHIKICEKVEYKGRGFTSQKIIDSVLGYSKVSAIILRPGPTSSLQWRHRIRRIRGAIGIALLLMLLLQQLPLRMYQFLRPILMKLSHLMENYIP